MHARHIVCLLFSTVWLFSNGNYSHAQHIVKSQTYWGTTSIQNARQELGITGCNKPNDISEPLHTQNDHPDLHRPAQMKDWEAPISIAIADGYLMLLHNPDGVSNHQYWCLLYDKARNMTNAFDLCAIGGQRDCEVTDIRYDGKQLFWNFSSIKSDAKLDGKNNRLFCYDTAKKQLLWKTKPMTSRNVFTLDQQYVYTGYGSTKENDYVYLIDRTNGNVLSQCPTASAPLYLELTNGGLYVQDSNNAYLFNVADEAIKVTGDNVNLREGASTSAPIFSNRNKRPIYPMKGDLLEYNGEAQDFCKVKYNGYTLYISQKFASIQSIEKTSFDKADQPSAGVRAWTDGSQDVSFEVYNMEKFVKAVELRSDEGNDLVANSTYPVGIDGATPCGVFLSPCKEYGSILFILTEEGKIYGLDMLEATADDGTKLQASDLSINGFRTVSLQSTQKNGTYTVWAIDAQGRKKAVNIAGLQL